MMFPVAEGCEVEMGPDGNPVMTFFDKGGRCLYTVPMLQDVLDAIPDLVQLYFLLHG